MKSTFTPEQEAQILTIVSEARKRGAAPRVEVQIGRSPYFEARLTTLDAVYPSALGGPDDYRMNDDDVALEKSIVDEARRILRDREARPVDVRLANLELAGAVRSLLHRVHHLESQRVRKWWRLWRG